jgi:predicted Zn-dependent protease
MEAYKHMKKGLLIVFCLLFIISSCETVPITGRQQLSLVSSQELNSMSLNAYQDFLSKNTIVRGTPQASMVKQVGFNIQKAVERFMVMQNLSSRLNGYTWEFNLVQDKHKNAWCMPGGRVVVYTGILPVTVDNAGLAVVMGHEIAHAIANHGAERMSQELLVQMGGMALATAVTRQPQQTQNLFLNVFGAGAQVGMLLPHSRLQESEADRLGTIFMAMAGYDPRSAIGFWQRMIAAERGSAATPELLSTHPADATRINNLKTYIAEAMKYYRR